MSVAQTEAEINALAMLASMPLNGLRVTRMGWPAEGAWSISGERVDRMATYAIRAACYQPDFIMLRPHELYFRTEPIGVLMPLAQVSIHLNYAIGTARHDRLIEVLEAVVGVAARVLFSLGEGLETDGVTKALAVCDGHKRVFR